MNFEFSEIAGILGLESSDHARIDTLLADSRDLAFPESTLFACIRTRGNDGHNYVGDMYGKGVTHFLVEYIPHGEFPKAEFLIVPDVMKAIQAIGKNIRSSIAGIPVIGITGSRGKTVMKELLNRMLRDTLRVARAPRSYNSQLGVPLTACDIEADAQIVIFEAGISQKGEMEALEEIIRPSIGIFTSITHEHDAGFASAEEKAREKAKLFKQSDIVYYPADETMIARALEIEAPNARRVAVETGESKTHIDRLKAIACRVAEDLGCKVTDLGCVKSISPRIDVRETLKNCLLVYDGYTNDYRSISDALNFAHRHLSGGRSLTLVLQYPDGGASRLDKLADLMKAKGVSRFIGVGFPEEWNEKLKGCVERCLMAPDLQSFNDAFSISDFENEVIVVKGEQENGFEEVTAMLEAPRHETVMEIDLGAITQNFNYYRSLLKGDAGLVAMVKADGYGIGSLELAKTMQSQGAAYLAVAVIAEGAELRRAGITMPIMVMNPIATNYRALFENRLEPSVFSMRELDLIIENARRLGIENYPVHIKLDTGMHRLGFLGHELDWLIDTINSQKYVKVASIFSHLATADCLDENEYTEAQLETFQNWSQKIVDGLPYKPMRHVLNTAGIMRYPEHHYDMARLGIGLYGVSPIPVEKDLLATVAKLSTTIISIKEWDEGTTIGYGRKGRIKGRAQIATIPIGYADGLNRRLSNGAASFIVNGKECPVVGNICMDQCMIDITGANASIGDKVEIFGDNAPIERLSDALGTIPYEILTSISPRVKRIYFRQ